MRLKSARLHGLMGVYSGSGKKEIFIDFTRCRNDIILIIGKNGSGKTTILNIISDSKIQSSKRSAELYLEALNLAVERKILNNSSFSFQDKEYYTM